MTQVGPIRVGLRHFAEITGMGWDVKQSLLKASLPPGGEGEHLRKKSKLRKAEPTVEKHRFLTRIPEWYLQSGQLWDFQVPESLTCLCSLSQFELGRFCHLQQKVTDRTGKELGNQYSTPSCLSEHDPSKLTKQNYVIPLQENKKPHCISQTYQRSLKSLSVGTGRRML